MSPFRAARQQARHLARSFREWIAGGKNLRHVDLLLPSLCRDALDRVSPLANLVWLLAALLYTGWVLFFLGYSISAAVAAQSFFHVFFADDWIKAALVTFMVGCLPWMWGDWQRRIGGAIVVWMSYLFLLAAIQVSTFLLKTYYFDGKPWPFSTWFAPTAAVFVLLVVSLLFEIMLAGVGLILYGSIASWRAFSPSSDEKDRGMTRLLYLFGVADSGFYDGLRPRLVMLLAKILLAVGLASGLAGFTYFVFMISPKTLPFSITQPLHTAFFAAFRLLEFLAGISASGVLGAYLLGFVFRRRFPPPRLTLEQVSNRGTLFLRSFRDDAVRLPRALSFSILPVPPDIPRNLDEILLERQPDTSAIGRPGETRAPFGVARHYLPSREWQNTVGELLEHADPLFISIDETAGVDWEISEALSRGLAPKVKFIMHPRLPKASKARVVAAFALELPDRKLRRLRGIDCGKDGDIRLYFGPANAASYRCMVGWMLNR